MNTKLASLLSFVV